MNKSSRVHINNWEIWGCSWWTALEAQQKDNCCCLPDRHWAEWWLEGPLSIGAQVSSVCHMQRTLFTGVIALPSHSQRQRLPALRMFFIPPINLFSSVMLCPSLNYVSFTISSLSGTYSSVYNMAVQCKPGWFEILRLSEMLYFQ